MFKQATLFCVPVILLTAVSNPGFGQQPPTADDAAARIADAVQREIDANLFPGAVVLIGTPEKVLYHEAFGFAQVVPERVPMRKDSLFDIASVTKVVCTATAVGILRDQGLIDPDAPMTRYLPDHQGNGVERITLRHLASHTSGFPDGPRVSYGGRYKGDAIFEHMLTEDPRWPVETRYHYACRNIILLSTMVERLSGQGFGEFCQERIFDPLEMTDSAFNRVEPSQRVVATHHPVLGENHNSDGRDAGRAVGNAGLFTSARDLSHFSEMMLGGGAWRGRRILTPETIAEFTTLPGETRFPKRAFIWEVDQDSSHRPRRMSPRAYGHSGNTGSRSGSIRN
jgi:serine-type D-Ala-D-Ala carboxypeptidase